MAVFYFQAKNISGQELSGHREAVDRYDLAGNLKKEGYFLLNYREDRIKTPLLRLASLFGRVPMQEKMVFARNLAVMVSAGVSLVKSMDVLSRQTDNRTWRKTLEDMGQEVKKGRALSKAMEDK